MIYVLSDQKHWVTFCGVYKLEVTLLTNDHLRDLNAMSYVHRKDVLLVDGPLAGDDPQTLVFDLKRRLGHFKGVVVMAYCNGESDEINRLGEGKVLAHCRELNGSLAEHLRSVTKCRPGVE